VLLLGLASLAMALVQGPITIFFGFLALRFLGFGSLQLVSNYTIAQWFIRRRGQVMGLAGLSLSIGLLIFPGLSQYLISHVGWRFTFVLLGVLVWAVMLPIGWGFFRERPELYGLRPDGDSLPLPSQNGEDGSTPEENWTLAEARQTSLFWLFTAGITVLTMILAGLVFHQTSLFEARGLSRAVAVNAFYVIAIFSVIGNLATGWLLDHTSPRWVLAGSLFLLAANMVMILVMHTPQEAFIFGALNGITGGAFRVLDAVVWAKYFGRLHLGSIRGAVMIGVVGGTALGPYPLGLSLDYLGSYTPVMLGLLVLPIGIGLAALLIKRPVKRGGSN
jgi:MFS family permease